MKNLQLVTAIVFTSIISGCIDSVALDSTDYSNKLDINNQDDSLVETIDDSINTPIQSVTDTLVDTTTQTEVSILPIETQTETTLPSLPVLPVLPNVPDMPILPITPDMPVETVTETEINQASDTETQTESQINQATQTQIEIEISQNCQSEQYMAGTAYLANQLVLNKDNVYRCNIAGWCSSSAGFAYEPGVGFGWTEAWELVEQCDATTATATPTTTNTTTTTVTQTQTATQTQTDNTVETETEVEMVISTPNAPSALLAQHINQQVHLSYVDNSDNETKFEIYRSVNSAPYELLSTLSVNAFSYIDSNITAGQTLIYIVRAVNTQFYSDFTAPSIITIEAEVIEPEVIEPELDVDELKAVYDAKCTACHQPQGFGGDLEDSSTQAQLINAGFDSLLAKTKTMSVSNCDDECFTQSATYVWTVLYEQTIAEVSADAQGVRGIRLLTPYEYQNSVYDVLNVSVSDSQLPQRAVSHEFKFDTDSDSGILNYEDVNNFYLLAKEVAGDFDYSNHALGNKSLQNYLTLAQNLFRQPLTSEELSTFTSVYQNESTQDAITVLLISPNFLYRQELGQYQLDEDAYQLTSYEVATALSYQLWGTTPNAWLLNFAENDQLTSQAQIETVAQIMIDDEKFATHFDHFLSFYTKSYDDLFEKPNLSQDVIDAMQQERKLATAYLFEQGTSNIDELFNPEYTFVNSVLGNHYGITTASSTMVKVTTDEHRGGLLHQGVLQIANSDFTSTSLVKRGKMIRENMMCHTMGVPSGVDPSDIVLPSYDISTQERWDIITGPYASQGQCWKCHQLMNEPGNALESFDSAGRYRTNETAYNNSNVSVEITPSGVLRDNTGFVNLTNYNNTRELAQFIANDASTRECFVDNLYRFGFGHVVDINVAHSVETVSDQFVISGNIKELLLNLVTSKHFLFRANR